MIGKKIFLSVSKIVYPKVLQQSNYYLKKLLQKVLNSLHCLRIYFAHKALTIPGIGNQTCILQLLEVVGDGRT